jgi:hypothetical protein
MNGRRGRTARVWCAGLVTASMGPVLAGCAGGSGGTASRPARISHIVFLKLQDPAQRGDLLADCDRLLPGIPGVVSYAGGRHLDVGRETVDGAYDIGLYIGFETEADYAGYVEHPNHVELLDIWRERLDWLRVHDVLDETE